MAAKTLLLTGLAGRARSSQFSVRIAKYAVQHRLCGYRTGVNKNDLTSQVEIPRMLFIRSYAKSAKKEKGKSKKGGGSKVDIFKTISVEELNEIVEYNAMCAKMQQSVDHLQERLVAETNVRSNPSAYDNIVVNTDDGRFRLMEIAQIIQKNPKLIVIDLGSASQYMVAVKKAIYDSGLNVNPQQDGTSLFVNVPKVTREHREGLAKNAHSLGTKAKDSLRNIQAKYLKSLKANCKEKDTLHHAQDALSNTFKKYSTEVDSAVDLKTKELLQET